LVTTDIDLELFGVSGKLIDTSKIEKGSTIASFDVRAVYDGIYLLQFSNGNEHFIEKVIISRK